MPLPQFTSRAIACGSFLVFQVLGTRARFHLGVT